MFSTRQQFSLAANGLKLRGATCLVPSSVKVGPQNTGYCYGGRVATELDATWISKSVALS